MLGASVSRPFIVKDVTEFAQAISALNENFHHLCDVRLHIVNTTECKVRIETNMDWPDIEEHGLEDDMPDFVFTEWLSEFLDDDQAAVLETSYPRAVGYTDERISPYWEVTIVNATGSIQTLTSDDWVEEAILRLGGDSHLNNQT